MLDFLEPQKIEQWIAATVNWAKEEVLVWGTLYQLAAVAVAMALAFSLSPFLRTGAARLAARFDSRSLTVRAIREVEVRAFPLVWLSLQWLFLQLAEGTKWGGEVIQATLSLLAAWLVIHFASLFIRNRAAARLAAFLIWVVAALNILGWLEPTVELLDAAAVDLGGFHLSVIVVLKGIILFVLLLWAALLLSQVIERRVNASDLLTPSMRVLTNQFSKIIFVTLAVVVALASVGVDLTAFAVFTGALGVGAGFGLQKVVANLFSGVLLLLDRSIKPGDVIAVGNTYGWVNFMGARYLSVITRDGTEHLIPNESLITNSVENWSYSDALLRLKIPLGVSYKSDLHKAIALVIEAAQEIERVLDEPKSICLVKGFGDSSVDLEARIWIEDPQNGIANVKSAVLLRIWDKFHENGIEIPFPQRDLHLKSGAEAIGRSSEAAPQ